MSRRYEIQVTDAYREAADRLHDEIIAASWPAALRFALDREGASERCNRRACATKRSCHVECKDGKPFECGGGATEQTIMSASELVSFASMMIMRYVEQVVIPEQQAAMRRVALAAQPLGTRKQVTRRRKLH